MGRIIFVFCFSASRPTVGGSGQHRCSNRRPQGAVWLLQPLFGHMYEGLHLWRGTKPCERRSVRVGYVCPFILVASFVVSLEILSLGSPTHSGGAAVVLTVVINHQRTGRQSAVAM